MLKNRIFEEKTVRHRDLTSYNLTFGKLHCALTGQFHVYLLYYIYYYYNIYNIKGKITIHHFPLPILRHRKPLNVRCKM